MAMDKNPWGTAIADAIRNIGIIAGPEITNNQLEIVWRAIKGEDISHLIANAEVTDVLSDGATESGPINGPYDINSLPGVGSITA